MDTVEVDINHNVDDLPFNDEIDPEQPQNDNRDQEKLDDNGFKEDFGEDGGDERGPMRVKRRNYRNQRPYGPRNRDFGKFQNYRETRGRGPYARTNNYQNKPNFKIKSDADELKAIKAKLVTLLDSFATAKEDIQLVYDELKVLPTRFNKLISIMLVECVETFPVKTGAYASLIGLLKVGGRAPLVESVNQQVLYNLGMKLSEGNRTASVLLLRFLVGLHCANVRSISVFEVLSSLLKLASEIENFAYDNNKDYAKSVVTLDNLNYIVLSSIPWFSREAFMSNVDVITSMCERLFEYSERRSRLLESLEADLSYNPEVDFSDTKRRFNPYSYKYFYKDTVTGTLEDRFTSGVQALRSLLKNDWTSSTTYRFYQSKGIVEKLNEPVEYEENKVTADNLNSVLQLDLKNFKNFKPVNPKSFNFNYTLDKSQLTTVHDKWLFEEHVYYVFDAFGDDSLRCAQQLLAIPLNEEFKEYGIVDVLLNLALSNFYNNYYSVFGILVMHNLCTLERKTEDIFYSFVSQLLVETDRLDCNVLNTLISICSFWFNMEFCKIRRSASDMTIEGENSDELQKELTREKNSRLFKTLFKPSNCANNYNLRLIEKISRLVYMDRLLTYSPRELEAEIKALNLLRDFKNKPHEHQLFLNMLHFNKLAPEENDLRNRRIITFINNYTNKRHLREAPKHLFSQTKETRDYDEVVHADEDLEASAQNQGDEQHSFDLEHPSDKAAMSEGAAGDAGSDGPVWERDELVMLFWDTLLIFGSKSMTHLYRLFEFHADVVKMLDTGDAPFEQSLPYKVMWQTLRTFERDQKKMELSFDFYVKRNVVNSLLVLQFLMTLPPEHLLTNFFFYALNSLFSEIHARLLAFREAYKVASRDLAGTIAMEAKKEELDSAESDYFSLLSLFVTLVSERLPGSDANLAKVLEELLLKVLVRYAMADNFVLRLYQAHQSVHERVKVTLYRLSMPSYLSN
ncbi:conserved hypothetical protein [Theileria orientalis strain Shintoku]|uniref:MIF4G domain-containing protein n=1 Tax=Theileria orientalis strain Shintoku TaxID=869250 RepID=J4D5F1_THEOR|nr:conserved hypothetical protein [Theileria orientalis strain Shintoku]PVC53511.1 hypothetical protein MACL_00003736 [Theileria orientalis]BAM38920.1 conserved hypothetical protein [Theileria orientalis strain Shintoku]|eukprot:XP_009689221.1 conserved hypothetical protein [Theileria orientalis strain Shintoku]